MYKEGVQLMAAIAEATKQSTTGSASESENAMLLAVKELTSEVKMFRWAYMAAHDIQPPTESAVEESVRRHFTNIL